MGQWLRTSAENGPTGDQTVSGVEFNLVVSPYDAPEAVRGRRDEKSGRFVIEFRYIDGDEPTELHQVDKQVTMQIGKHSGRLRAIDLDVVALGVGAVGVTIDVAAKSLEEKVDRFWAHLPSSIESGSRNVPLARRAFEQRKSEVIRELVPA